MKRLALLLTVTAALVLAGCSSAARTGSSASVDHRIRAGTITSHTTTTSTTSATTTTVPALPPTLPVETESNDVVTLTGFTACTLRPDPEIDGVDATANGSATLHPPAAGGNVEMDIVDSSGKVVEAGLPTPLQSWVFSSQPVTIQTDFSADVRASACVVHWVTPLAPSNQGTTVQQPPPPPTTTPTPSTYPPLP